MKFTKINIEKEIEIENTLSPWPSLSELPEDTEQGGGDSPEQRINLFSRFWDAYPRKENKTAAVNAWNALMPDRELVDRMLAAIKAKSKSEEWTKQNGRFVPRADKWLSERRWEDSEPQTTKVRELSAAERKAIDELMRG